MFELFEVSGYTQLIDAPADVEVGAPKIKAEALDFEAYPKGEARQAAIVGL